MRILARAALAILPELRLALAGLIVAAGVALSGATPAADPGETGVTRGVPVKTGDAAPDFTLVDQDGRSHTLSGERGKRPVVVIFYRGYW